MFQKLIGDRAFYRRVAAVAIPIVIQNAISNFVSLLDNIMVGQLANAPMSGVAIVNQLLFIFYLCIFGAMAGAGIFTAQFYGNNDHTGIRQTFRFKFLASLLLGFGGIAVLYFAGKPLISLYLQSDSNPAEAAATLQYGLDYLHVMLWGLAPFAIGNAYASTLRETGKTSVPMVAGVAAVLVNLALNYVFIFGKFGAPAMGVKGAALATVISRYVELAIMVLWTHLNPAKNPFIQRAYRSMHIPRNLLKNIFLKGMPLLANEFLFATGMAILNQCYSTRGLDVVAALNISTTIYNLASVIYLSMGNVVGILIGQMMGGGSTAQQVRDSHNKLTALSVASCLVFGILLVCVSGVFPLIYNTTEAVRSLAAQLIWISALCMPLHAYIHAIYFALRAGGKTGITFLFDSGFVWLCTAPLAFILSQFTTVPILPLYILCQGTDLLKCALGTWMIRKDSWIQNLTQV